MGQLTIRQTSAELPRFDPDLALEPLPRIGAQSRLVTDFQLADATLDAFELVNARLLHGKIRMLRAGTASITSTRMESVEFTGCDLAGSAFDGCDLRLTGFGPGNYRRCDLRGNDLSALIGAARLKHVIIDRAQTMQLAEALAAELEVTFGDEVSGRS